MNTKRGFTPIIILLITSLVLVGIVGYYLSLKRRLQVDLGWKEYSSDSCGTAYPKTRFSISIPSDWNFSVQEDKYWARHTLSGTSSEKFIIVCGTGFGGACPPENQKEIRLGNEIQLGCYGEREGRVYLSQIGAGFGEVGVTIEADFPNNESGAETLNQILSTFKFTD